MASTLTQTGSGAITEKRDVCVSLGSIHGQNPLASENRGAAGAVPALAISPLLAAAEHMDILVLARDGDRERPEPHSLGPAARFVVDHAPCRLLLIWPDPPIS